MSHDPVMLASGFLVATQPNLPFKFLEFLQLSSAEDAKWREWGWTTELVMWFPCRELTCCCTQHETNVGMTMRLSQLLFFQVRSCCPLRLLLLLLYFFLLMLLCLITVFMPGEQSWVRHSNAPARRSLNRAWDNGRATGGGETLSFCECRRETERGQGTVKGRGCESEFLGLLDRGEDRGTMLGIYAGLMGPDSAEYTEGQQGSTLTFLFTQSAALCVRTVIDWRPVQGGSLPFAQCMLGISPASLNWRRE